MTIDGLIRKLQIQRDLYGGDVDVVKQSRDGSRFVDTSVVEGCVVDSVGKIVHVQRHPRREFNERRVVVIT